MAHGSGEAIRGFGEYFPLLIGPVGAEKFVIPLGGGMNMQPHFMTARRQFAVQRRVHRQIGGDHIKRPAQLVGFEHVGDPAA